MLATGLDRLLANPQYLSYLAQKKVGALVHTASVTSQFEHAIDALVRAGVRPVRLFGPEHGLRVEAQMMVAGDHAIEPINQFLIQSLYDNDETSLAPQIQAVQDLALIIY